MVTDSSCNPSRGLSKKLETPPFSGLGVNTIDLPHDKSFCIDYGGWSRPGPTARMEHVAGHFLPLKWEFCIRHFGVSDVHSLDFSEPQNRLEKQLGLVDTLGNLWHQLVKYAYARSAIHRPICSVLVLLLRSKPRFSH